MNQSKGITSSTVFCFPSETTVSFIILIIAAIFVSINIGENIERSFIVFFEKPGEENLAPPYPKNDTRDPTIIAKDYVMISLRMLLVPSLCILLLIAVTLIIFYRFPGRIRSKSQSEINLPLNLRTFVDNAKAICYSILRKPIEVLITNSFLTANAQAFGNGFRNYIMLDGGLWLLSQKFRKKFEAILFHELGHIINKDVSKTYLSVSIWYSVFGLFALPLTLLLTLVFFDGIAEKISSGKNFLSGLPYLMKAFVQMILLFATVVFFRNSVLRSREFSADLRSVTFGYREELLSILSKTVEKKRTLKQRFMSFHPTAKQRISVIENPGMLFSLNPSMSFLSGVLQSLIVNGLFSPMINIALLLGSAMFPKLDANSNLSLTYFLTLVSFALPFLIFLVSSPLIAFPFTGSIGLQTLKQSYSRSITERRPAISNKEYFTMPALFIAGSEIGYLLQPISNLSPDSISKLFLVILSHTITFFSIIIIMTFSAHAGRKLSNMDPIHRSFRRLIYRYLTLETVFFAFVMLLTVFIRLMIVLNIWNPFS